MDKATKAAKETTSMFDKLAATSIKLNNIREAFSDMSDALSRSISSWASTCIRS